ncbi:dihydrolipoamide acetyltransferase component of pyruvate dehydrogenase [Dorcoceras hygrometricum]|uniref:Acetyltransferase component of pyruvate dehydrogenase complex n=1 Tax=Dorcoceras hygrometricum TaxID=472368 RepID=A0A2Z7CGI2_9LAMI|nr:dihydrolipoamide acetyltransferase component of pyruvate dehydrogenase [Dorcoceras hygrometricum]
MTYASRILNHSNKFRHGQNILQNDCAIVKRWFTDNARLSVDKIDEVSRSRQHGLGPGDKSGLSKLTIEGCFSASRRAVYPTKELAMRICKGNTLLARKLHASATGIEFSRQRSSARSFSTDSGLPPHQEIGMPSLSPTMTEGNIARWLKKEGDKVSTGEVLCEVETDKATVEMECMEEGYLAKILRGDGSSGIKVGETIAITVEEEEDVTKFKDYKPSTSDAAAAPKSQSAPTAPKKETAEVPVTSPEPEVSKPATPPSDGDRVFASPLAKKLAEDNNVSLSNIKGTGPDGRILKADIEDHLASHGKGDSGDTKVGKPTSGTPDYTDIPHTQIRKITASRLLQSKQTIPHYYLTVDTCVDKLMELRSHLNSLQEAAGGKRISVNDLVIKAAALALRKVPRCNSSWTNDYIRQYHTVNINVAVQTDNGLYVPVIRDADQKGLSKISDEVKRLAQKAKENSLKPEDYEGGTFTVSNLGGPFGIKQFCAIINPPQSGILAVGSGAIGAEWLKAFKGYIENPESMLL